MTKNTITMTLALVYLQGVIGDAMKDLVLLLALRIAAEERKMDDYGKSIEHK